MLPAPAAGGTIPTLSLRILPWLPGPLSRRYMECMCLFLPPHHRPSPVHYRGRLSRICPSKRFLDGSLFRDCSHFFMFRPPGLLTPRSFPPQRLIASGRPGLLSEQNMLRFLRMHRTLLTIRIQAIDGVGTYTPQDLQPCRLLQCNGDVSPIDDWPVHQTVDDLCNMPTFRVGALRS